MKHFLLVSIFLAISCYASSQNINIKDLTGEWKCTNGSIDGSMRFIDSCHLKFSNGSAVLHFSIEQMKNYSYLVVGPDTKDSVAAGYFAIQQLNENKFSMQLIRTKVYNQLDDKWEVLESPNSKIEIYERLETN